MKGSYRDDDLKWAGIMFVSGVLSLSIILLISYFVTGKWDQIVGFSWCLLPIGLLLILGSLSKLLGALTGTSDNIGRSTSFRCPHCSTMISTKDIPLAGETFSCPRCKRILMK